MIIQIFPARLLALVEPVKFKNEEWIKLKSVLTRELEYGFEKEYSLLSDYHIDSEYFMNVVNYYFLKTDLAQTCGFDEYLRDKKIYLDYIKRNSYEPPVRRSNEE